jgi:hypothetical protein
MTLPAVGVTSATKIVPYLSNAMFATHARRGVDVTALVPKGDAADQAAALADYIRQASAAMDSFLLGTLAATLDTEVGPVTIKPSGVAVVVPRFRPIIALTAFSAGPNIAQLTAYTNLTAVSVEDRRILIPVGPFGTWNTSQGPLQFGYAAPVPGELYARWTTCNGYPVTWLTAPAALGATTISVADTTGIIAGQTQLTLCADHYRYSFVPTAVSTAGPTGFGVGPGVLTLPVALPQGVANDALYPTYVSALPPDVNMAAVYMTRAFIKSVSGGNVQATSQSTKNKDPLGAGDDMAQAYELIDQYQMVQR